MECPHPTVRADEQRSWLVAESDQHKALCTIVQDKKLTSDLQQLARFCHTGTLENFHSVLLKWCPKRIHFSYEGMRARSQLACLSHNENVGRAQATTAAGILRHKLVFPKAKGHWVVKKLYKCTTHKFMFDLMDEVHKVRITKAQKETPQCMEEYETPKIPRNIAREERPDKAKAIQAHASRMKSS